INDAIQFWSNHFQKSKLKAILQFLSDHNIDFCQSPDKQKAKYSICRYIKRINIKLKHKFKNIGKDSCKCVRGKIPISISLKNMDNDINDFILAFDKKEYSSKCHIDNFIFNRYKVQIGKFIKKAEGLKKKDDTIGFINLVKNLNDVTKKETSYLSCKICERIGDVVIALETPREMILEHTDYSFNLLCPIIDQPHKQHISEMKYIKK
ncbi:MAG: hypothetical protein KKH98_14705, partial [Spirochaetes bacterium]|nr:hypothetical protein [Spirochaetota bacterium]